MKALFPPWATSLARVLIGLAVIFILGAPLALMAWVRTPLVRGQYDPVVQPVQFDHRHHVRDDGIDCRYCHYEAERSPYAGVPPASLCMKCHSQIWNASPLLEPIRDTYFRGRTLAWQRVHNVPDFAFFNHAAHVMRGVGCVSCHGRVDLMGAVYQVMPLTMGWCLDCHRNPEPHLRPQSEITNMEWVPPEPPAVLGARIRAQRKIEPPTTCSACHR
jgi:hypothetical protein